MRLHLGFVTKKVYGLKEKNVSGAKMKVAKAKEAANSGVGTTTSDVLPFFVIRQVA